MFTLKQFLSAVATIDIQPSGPLVESTVANEIRAVTSGSASVKRSPGLSVTARGVRIAVVEDAASWQALHPALGAHHQWMMVRIRNDGVELLASHPHLLYQCWTLVQDEWAGLDVAGLKEGKIVFPTFPAVRPVYDIFLTQIARTQRGFNNEEHFKTLARLGSKYAEVNGLAFPVPFETGPKGELLHRFYTSCPALDQFVTSRLNKGIYDNDYLQANLNNLKANAALAEKYGLVPGLVCFEPRSVPDELLQRYPVLRGARVDHPMRSFRPRFNLSVAHPVVLDHWRVPGFSKEPRA